VTRHVTLPPRTQPELELTEKQFQQQVLDLADFYGWEHYHSWLSIHSQTGWPDLALVRPPRLVFAELKRENGKLTANQGHWLGLLERCPGCEVFVWRPHQLQEIAQVLR
jgi:hypothetical protein